MGYVYDRTDVYWLTSDLLWHLIPWILMIVGIIALLIGVLKGRSGTVVVSQ